MDKIVLILAVLVVSGVLWACVFFAVERSYMSPLMIPTIKTSEGWNIRLYSTSDNYTDSNEVPKQQFPAVKTFKKNWNGDCSYPSYIPSKVQRQNWFPRYLHHLQRVNLSTSSKARRPINCARWWYPTPQITYDEVPHREIGWKLKPRLKKRYKRPKCSFGQLPKYKSRCAKIQAELWRTLDKLGVVYFPRSGTELGILRGSSYLSTDGDIDIFVDMPQRILVKKLAKILKPAPKLYGKAKEIKTETHWLVRGCPPVHMVFNDWMVDEMVKEFGRPNHTDTCECMMNSVTLTCHKEAFRRMYLQYGPSWKVPLHAKALDVPHRARNYNIVDKLNEMASKDGIIYEDAVLGLDFGVEYDDEEMEMILAQLNVLKFLIYYQRKTKKYNVV